MGADRRTWAETAPDHSSSGARTSVGRRGLRRWRPPGKAKTTGAAVAVIAGGSVIGLALSSLAGLTSAPTTPGWIMTAGNVQALSQQSSATAAHFFDTSTSYGAGASLVQSPVQRGYSTTPLLSYGSYAQFKSDIQNKNISYPYHWVMYDPEHRSTTPVNEQRDPVRYMRLFGQLAQARGLKVIMAPALDLGSVAGSLLPRLAHETMSDWYVRNDIAAAAAYGNIYLVQDEWDIPALSQYDWLFSKVSAQARAANAGIKVYSEVSTVNGTAAQMAAAAQSVSADGYYVAAPGSIPRAGQFFQDMRFFQDMLAARY